VSDTDFADIRKRLADAATLSPYRSVPWLRG